MYYSSNTLARTTNLFTITKAYFRLLFFVYSSSKIDLPQEKILYKNNHHTSI